MRWLVEYFRSLFCKHDFELLDELHLGKPAYDYIYVYRCKKCGYVKKSRVIGW